MSIKSRLKNSKTFDNLFGFESGVDITDETNVLYRRNNVIKRIIFLSNLVFSASLDHKESNFIYITSYKYKCFLLSLNNMITLPITCTIFALHSPAISKASELIS